MRVAVIIFLYALLFSNTALACGNSLTFSPIHQHREHRTLADGSKYSFISSNDAPQERLFSQEEKAEFLKTLKNLKSQYAKTHNLDYLSDIGLVKMFLGHHEEAKKIFLGIEAKEPNRYATAANLGTTYELLGDNKKALTWIKKAVALNADSHKGSEWIHVNILEAKVKGKKFHTSEYILKTNFGDKQLPKSDLSTAELQTLHDQILYQLDERIQFIKPKNTIISELFVALADSAFLLEKYSGANYNYSEAQDYGNKSPVITARRNEARARAIKQFDHEKLVKQASIASGFLVITLLPLIFVQYRLKKQRTGFIEDLPTYPTKKVLLTYALYGGFLGTLVAVTFAICLFTGIIFFTQPTGFPFNDMLETNDMLKTYVTGLPICTIVGSIPSIIIGYILTLKKTVVRRRKDLLGIFTWTAIVIFAIGVVYSVAIGEIVLVAITCFLAVLSGFCVVVIGNAVLPRSRL